MFIEFNQREAIIKNHINKDKKEIAFIYGYSFGIHMKNNDLKNIRTSIKVNLSKSLCRKKHESILKLKYDRNKRIDEKLLKLNNDLEILENSLKNDEIFLFGKWFVAQIKKNVNL